MNDAALCRKNEWIVGDILEGDEGFGPERMLITAIGESALLGISLKSKRSHEGSWALAFRNWKKVAVRCADCYLPPEEYEQVADMLNCKRCGNTGIVDLPISTPTTD